ncbi:cell wall hydrolase [Iocasia frigidifontis]|uniref:cell wall hydrolase n=1 Tax=Iocasia fonsfrigidae TaxID=2682810 RepID=UPI001E31C5FF|nr:cell wall hydrolase [Iocasia fonsfrigidae]
MTLKTLKKKILFIFLICLFVVVYQLEVSAAYNLIFGERILKDGDEGADVAILQRKLKELSYYNGVIDGLYGKGTTNAVKLFQRDKGLMTDGIVGDETYQALPKGSLESRMDVSREEIILLARIINGEARGESFRGKVAVGAVIINRVESDSFPNSIREVILQRNQFSCLLDGQANFYPQKSSIDAARAALLGYDPTYGSLFFYNPKVATNVQWISTRPVVASIGDHIFAR